MGFFDVIRRMILKKTVLFRQKKRPAYDTFLREPCYQFMQMHGDYEFFGGRIL